MTQKKEPTPELVDRPAPPQGPNDGDFADEQSSSS